MLVGYDSLRRSDAGFFLPRHTAMEALVVVGLVSNIIQIVDVSSKLLLSSKEIYRSSSGVLTEYADIETAATHLVSLNNKIKDSISATSDNALKRLCESCSSTTDELFAALNMVKVEDKNSKWKSIRKALRSIWTKEKITALEERLARLREEVNLHLILNVRYVSKSPNIDCANTYISKERTSWNSNWIT